MMATPDRREHLMLGAVTGELTVDEQRELDELIAQEPSVGTEIEQMRSVMTSVDGLGSWIDADTTPALDAAIAAVGGADTDSRTGDLTDPAPGVQLPQRAGHRSASRRGTTRHASSGSTRSSRRVRSVPWRGVAAAMALVVVGAGGALGIERVVNPSSLASGEPGTLGAAEEISFASEGAGEIDGSVVAHTWGTEAVLTVDGLNPGQTYDVLFVDERGSTIDAGSFLGSEVQINCSTNAAILREDVASVRIVADDGATVRAADLPPVSG